MSKGYRLVCVPIEENRSGFLSKTHTFGVRASKIVSLNKKKESKLMCKWLPLHEASEELETFLSHYQKKQVVMHNQKYERLNPHFGIANFWRFAKANMSQYWYLMIPLAWAIQFIFFATYRHLSTGNDNKLPLYRYNVTY